MCLVFDTPFKLDSICGILSIDQLIFNDTKIDTQLIRIVPVLLFRKLLQQNPRRHAEISLQNKPILS